MSLLLDCATAARIGRPAARDNLPFIDRSPPSRLCLNKKIDCRRALRFLPSYGTKSSDCTGRTQKVELDNREQTPLNISVHSKMTLRGLQSVTRPRQFGRTG